MSTQTQKQIDPLQSVRDAAQRVIHSKQELPDYKMAQLMLKLMNGDTSVIGELPTLNPPALLNADDTAELGTALVNETSSSSVAESKGLLGLTTANIRDIKTYVKKSLCLKTTEKEVESILDYDKNAPFCKKYPDFAPAKFAEFYKPFNEHAMLWNAIEADIIAQGNAIQVYGTTFVSHASFVLKVVDTMNLTKAVEDITVIDPEDQKTQKGLGEILTKWQNETIRYQASTDYLLHRLTSFQGTLVNKLQPSASTMFSLLSRLDLAAETKQLKDGIDSLQLQINAKQKEYNTNCGLAFAGAAGIIGGPLVLITWSVTGGIYGAKAEKARKERNALQEELNKKNDLYKSINSVAGNVHKATDGIADLSIAITNAIAGLKTLSAVWNLLTQFITSARDNLKEVECKSQLMIFKLSIEAAGASWVGVPSIAGNLLDLFKQADKAVTLYDTFCESRRESDLPGVAAYKFDNGMWADKYAALNHVIITPESTVMPTLQHKAAELRSHARAVDEAVTESLPLTVVQAKLVQTASSPSRFDKCTRQLAEDPSDAEALEYFNALADNLTKMVGKFGNVLDTTEKNISDSVTILKENTRTDLSVTGFYAQLNNECKRFGRVVQEHTQMVQNNIIDPIRALEERMKKLDAGIEKKLDPESVMKRFKEFLPPEKEISTMLEAGKSQEAAAVEGIKLVYSTALRSLDVLGSTIKLCQEVSELSALADRLGELRAQYADAKRQLQGVLNDQAELNNLLSLQGVLTFYVESGNAEAGSIHSMRTSLSGYVNATAMDYQGCHEAITEFIEMLQGRYDN